MVRSNESGYDYIAIDDRKEELPPLSIENYALTEKDLRRKQRAIQEIGEAANQMMIQELGSSFCRRVAQNFTMPKGIFVTIVEDIADIMRNITSTNEKNHSLCERKR